MQGHSWQQLVRVHIPSRAVPTFSNLSAGSFSLVPLMGAWNSNNIGGSLKRGVGIAMQVGFGNLGGIISAFVYQSKDAPRLVR